MVISNILFKLSQYYATLLPKAQSISDHLPKIVQFLPLPHKTLFNIFQFILNYPISTIHYDPFACFEKDPLHNKIYY